MGIEARWRRLMALGGVLLEGEGGGGGGGGDDPLKKAQFERDSAVAREQKLKDEIDALKKKLPTDDQLKRLADLEKAAADAEEDRKKKSGEFESLKQDLVKKHNDELTKRDTEIQQLRNTIADREIGLAFAGAYIDKTPLFGDDKAMTILPPELAAKALRDHIEVEHVDGRVTLKVKDSAGKVIIDPKTGNPMAFAPAMLEAINSLPTKDRILRGSGKTGSGSSGGGGGSKGDTVDFSNLTPEQMRDPKVIADAKRRTAAAGGVVSGGAWDRMQKGKA